jgi:hypothetical protein
MTEQDLRAERLSLTIGNILGQLAQLLNQVARETVTMKQVYEDLKDITAGAALQTHELYYKGNKRE